MISEAKRYAKQIVTASHLTTCATYRFTEKKKKVFLERPIFI